MGTFGSPSNLTRRPDSREEIDVRYKPLFRLMLKLLGIYCTADGVASALYHGSWWVEFMFGSTGTFYSIPGMAMQLGACAVKLGLGCYLFFGGRWIVDKAIPGNRPYCPECGYDLTGAGSDRCPECGTPFRIADLRPRGDGDTDQPSA